MIKAVVFDIGRVILPIDWSRVIQTLGISEQQGSELGHKVATGDFYDKYERGDISTEEFFQGFEKQYGLQHSPEEIREAWMKLLLPPYIGIDEVLNHLKDRVEVFALSNTNKAHSDFFMKEFEVFGHFHEIFTSHGLNARKPEKQIFEKLLQITNRRPEETLFLDDMEANVAAARELGIHAEKVVDSVGEVKVALQKFSLWK